MSLLSYREARPWARAIREKVVTREMPPWHADPQFGDFTNSRRLTDEQVKTIVAWVDQGAMEGDPSDLPPSPRFQEGWNGEKPDSVLYMPQEFRVPASGVVDYQYFAIPTNFGADKWIQGVEIRPGNRSVVHHILAMIDYGGSQKFLAAYAPGELPLVLPTGLAAKLPANASLVLQVHYTPNGAAATDRSYIGLIFSKRRPDHEMELMPVMNTRFAIPPGASNYKVEATYTFKEDSHIYLAGPHMHLRGKDFVFKLVNPDGSSRVILSVPRYDFSWQTHYIFKEPIAVPRGSRLECVAHFDNSSANKVNPDPTKEVRWGEQTWEEMIIGWVSFAADKTEEAMAESRDER
jgi:hypothetical protein